MLYVLALSDTVVFGSPSMKTRRHKSKFLKGLRSPEKLPCFLIEYKMKTSISLHVCFHFHLSWCIWKTILRQTW